jgi:hypothetical protein
MLQAEAQATTATIDPAPPPWSLTGDGYILLYRWPRDFAAAHSPYGPLKGGLGVVMLVNYHTTNVGPYREALFVPGVVALPGQTGYSISKIYVTTQASVVNGQENWGIPKEQADFTSEMTAPGQERIRATRDGQTFLDATLRFGGPRFPVWAWLMPPVVQHWGGRTFVTKIRASGRAQFASLHHMDVDDALFPPVHQFRPLLAVKVAAFKLTFPVPAMRA